TRARALHANAHRGVREKGALDVDVTVDLPGVVQLVAVTVGEQKRVALELEESFLGNFLDEVVALVGIELEVVHLARARRAIDDELLVAVDETDPPWTVARADEDALGLAIGIEQRATMVTSILGEPHDVENRGQKVDVAAQSVGDRGAI